jgi:nucleotide-binding universal stress UspA family protein
MSEHGAVVVGLGDGRGGHPELDWAAREAQARKRPLHIVRGYELVQATLPWPSSSDRMIRADLRRGAQQRITRAVAHVRAGWPGVEVDGVAVDGRVAETLIQASRTAPVTVLGSRRLGALGAAVLGSVSSVVAAAGSGPIVVTGRPGALPGEAAPVVVGVDGSEFTEDVLGFAFDYATRHGRDLHAVFCWRLDPLAEAQWRPAPPAPARAERWLAEMMAGWREKYPDVETHQSVVRGHPVEALVATAAGADILVVGSHSRHARMSALLGSVSQGVLHHSTCPVAVVHPPAASLAEGKGHEHRCRRHRRLGGRRGGAQVRRAGGRPPGRPARRRARRRPARSGGGRTGAGVGPTVRRHPAPRSRRDGRRTASAGRM